MQSTEIFLRAVQNTVAKFSPGEHSNQIKHGDSKHTLFSHEPDEWTSVASGNMEIFRNTQSSILDSHYTIKIQFQSPCYLPKLYSLNHYQSNMEPCHTDTQ